MRPKSLCIRLIVFLILPGCSLFLYKDQEIRAPEVETDIPATLPDTTEKKKPGKTQVGKASWYGANFHGKKTASGAVFDANQRTAAHRSFPFGSKVRVTRLDNNKSVEVEINDRGPFVGGRIIDLSRAAAAVLGMMEEGAVTVRVELLDSTSAQQTAVQP
ncbi:MAG TPA: septal ring lytic transglycosylase RlpA family protein [Candidatus Binatia bacterium]|jgi:rare lipoprotein A|nr:septal ring lytic transglycosylase RlpA family protein [Candidatus Binatia bacterium]